MWLSGGLLWWTWSGEGNATFFFSLIFPRSFLSKKPYDLLKPYHLAMKTWLSSSQLFFLKSDHSNKRSLLSYSRRKTRIKEQQNNRERMLSQGRVLQRVGCSCHWGRTQGPLGPGKCCQGQRGRQACVESKLYSQCRLGLVGLFPSHDYFINEWWLKIMLRSQA